MEKEKEIRNVSSQFKIAGEGDETRTVEGYAFLFNVPSDGLSFQETIEPGAADGVIAKSDVFAVLNHDQERGILARSKYGKGSLSLTVDEKGLRYSFEAPKTALGDELLENLRRGEIDQSSFCFDVEKDAWEKGRMALGNVPSARLAIFMTFPRCITLPIARHPYACAERSRQRRKSRRGKV